MTNLPISSHKPQSTSNGASMQPATIATDNQAVDTQSVNPFASLLAKQIGEADLSALKAALATIAVNGDSANSSDGITLKDMQDMAAAASSKSDDPATIIANILQQLPATEDKVQKVAGQQAALPYVHSTTQQTDSSQAKLGSTPETGYHKPAVPLVNDQIVRISAIDHLPLETVKLAKLLSGQSQPAQSITPPSGYAAMPGTLANSTPSIGTTPTIATPLGHPGWADEFSQKISWISTQQNQVAKLHLNPPNLGPLDVILKISDNQATALFTSPHGAVREAVENALPKLREILADNGIMLGNTTVSDQPPRDRGAEGFMEQSFGSAAQLHMGESATGSPDGSQETNQMLQVRRHNGIVDTFV